MGKATNSSDSSDFNPEVVRYIVGDLDPAEHMEIENQIRQDEDLLIEAESLKQTFLKLEKLPEFKPPEYLSERILAQATGKKGRKIRVAAPVFALKYVSYAAAASIIFAAGFFGHHYLFEHGTIQAKKAVVLPGNAAKPWKNTNDVLTIKDYDSIVAEENADSSLRNLNRGLRQVDEYPSKINNNNQVRLTGVRKQ